MHMHENQGLEEQLAPENFKIKNKKVNIQIKLLQ